MTQIIIIIANFGDSGTLEANINYTLYDLERSGVLCLR